MAQAPTINRIRDLTPNQLNDMLNEDLSKTLSPEKTAGMTFGEIERAASASAGGTLQNFSDVHSWFPDLPDIGDILDISCKAECKITGPPLKYECKIVCSF